MLQQIPGLYPSTLQQIILKLIRPVELSTTKVDARKFIHKYKIIYMPTSSEI